MEYELDVTVDNGSVIRTKIIDDHIRSSYSKTFDKLTSEHGRNFWVVFYPEDTSQMKIDHFGEDDFEAPQQYRRIELNKITIKNDELKLRGDSAEASITRVDDLELPYPQRNSRGMFLYFDVTRNSGAPFKSECHSLMLDSAIVKYSVGKKVYIRYDRENPKWAALDTERNKSIK